MVKKSFKKKGTTLPELMIVVAIVGIIASLAPTLIKNISRFSQLSDARLETQKNVREALTQINQALRQASASSIIISQETNQPPYSSILFDTVDGRTLKYYQSGKSLFFVKNGSTKTLSKNLRYLAFLPPKTEDPNILSVSVTFEKGTYEGQTKALQMSIEKVRIMND